MTADPMRPGIVFDEGRHHRAKLGFVLLSSEQTIESEMMRHAPEGVGVHFTRSPNPDQITSENLAAMIEERAQDLAQPADLWRAAVDQHVHVQRDPDLEIGMPEQRLHQ